MAWFRKPKPQKPLYRAETLIYLAGAANQLSNTDLTSSLTQTELFTKRLSELEDEKKEKRREATIPVLQALICFLLLPWLPKDPLFFYISIAFVGMLLLAFAFGSFEKMMRLNEPIRSLKRGLEVTERLEQAQVQLPDVLGPLREHRGLSKRNSY